MPKTVILLFGETGAGKSYWGQKLKASLPSARFVEGDAYVPLDMSRRVRLMLPPTKDQLDELVEDLRYVPEERFDLGYDNVIISQALYRNEHRKDLITYWNSQGYTVYPVWVRVPFWQHLCQLWNRECRGGLKWVLFCLMNKLRFEKPTHGHYPPETVAAIYSYGS